MKTNYFLSILVALLLVVGCTPKTGEKTTVETPKVDQPVVEKDEGDCVTWNGKSFKSDAMENHVMYRQELEEKSYESAYGYWRKVFDMAPAADGQRDYQYTDGMKIYKGLLETEKDEAKKEAYIKEIISLYDRGMECFPAKASMYKSLKAYDLFYTFPGRADDAEVFQLFKDVVDLKGKDSPAYVINPFTSLLVNGLLEEKIQMAEAQRYTGKILEAIAEATKKYKAKNDPKWTSQGWDVVEGYAPARLEQLEGLEGFYDCAYYKNKYMGEFNAASTDCEVISTTIGRLRWAKCSDTDVELASVLQAKAQHCKAPPPPPIGPLRLAKEALDRADYRQAIKHYEDFVNSTDDTEKKAKYSLRIAKIYYVHLKSFSKARKYARQATKHRPSWGEPYMLIGRLYASSGPLCGPGTGWDSQVVTWPAIDKWKKAKSVDSSVTAEANKLINRYSQYMPSKGDIFQKLLKEGDTYKVGCWIQENTTVRAAK